MSQLKGYEVVDEFILDTCNALGDTYTPRQLREWIEEKGYEIDSSLASRSHYTHPKLRAFTTRRTGHGRATLYTLIERQQGVASASVREIHTTWARESLKRWINERRRRVDNVADRSQKAKAILDSAEAKMALVAQALDVELAELETPEDEDAE